MTGAAPALSWWVPRFVKPPTSSGGPPLRRPCAKTIPDAGVMVQAGPSARPASRCVPTARPWHSWTCGQTSKVAASGPQAARDPVLGCSHGAGYLGYRPGATGGMREAARRPEDVDAAAERGMTTGPSPRGRTLPRTYPQNRRTRSRRPYALCASRPQWQRASLRPALASASAWRDELRAGPPVGRALPSPPRSSGASRNLRGVTHERPDPDPRRQILAALCTRRATCATRSGCAPTRRPSAISAITAVPPRRVASPPTRPTSRSVTPPVPAHRRAEVGPVTARALLADLAGLSGRAAVPLSAALRNTRSGARPDPPVP